MVVGCEFEPRSWRGVPDTTLCDKSLSVTCERSGVFLTNNTDRHDITEILLKVALNTIKQKQTNKQTQTHPFSANRYRLYDRCNLNYHKISSTTTAIYLLTIHISKNKTKC
jgi:hypothetical protein